MIVLRGSLIRKAPYKNVICTGLDVCCGWQLLAHECIHVHICNAMTVGSLQASFRGRWLFGPGNKANDTFSDL